MGLIRTVDPAEEPLSLDEVRLHLKQDTDADDELIMALIAAARSAAEDYTLRALVTQTWQLRIDDDWPYCDDDPLIVLPRPPVASVASIQYVDQAGATQTLATDQYQLFKRSTGEWAIEPAYDVIWPDVREQAGTITVTFVAGLAVTAVPPAIRSAMLLLIGHLYQNRESVNVGNIMPMSTQFLLDPYRVHPYR